MSSPLSQTPCSREPPRNRGALKAPVVVRHPVDVAQPAEQAVSTAQLVMLGSRTCGTAPQIPARTAVPVSWELEPPLPASG